MKHEGPVSGASSDFSPQKVARRRGRIEVNRQELRYDECIALIAIAAYWLQHSVGPPWRSVGRAAGWHLHNGELYVRLSALKRAGLVTFTREPRSLNVTAGAAARALRRREQLRARGGRP